MSSLRRYLLLGLLVASCTPLVAVAEQQTAEMLSPERQKLESSISKIKHDMSGNDGKEVSDKAPLSAIAEQAGAERTQASPIKMFQGLGFCLGVFLIGIYLSKKFGARSTTSGKRMLRVKEKMPVTQKTSLLVVEYQGKDLLIAVGPDHVSNLTTPEPMEGPAEGSATVFEGALEELCEEEFRLSA